MNKSTLDPVSNNLGIIADPNKMYNVLGNADKNEKRI